MWRTRVDVFTLVSFHKAQSPVKKSQLVWMHTVFYGLYTASSPALSIPQGMMSVPTDMITKEGTTPDGFIKYGYEKQYYPWKE